MSKFQWEYLKVEGNMWLDEVKWLGFVKGIEWSAALMQTNQLNVKLTQIGKAIRDGVEIGKWGDDAIDLTVRKRDADIKKAVTESLVNWETNVAKLIQSLDAIIGEIKSQTGVKTASNKDPSDNWLLNMARWTSLWKTVSRK